MPTATMNIMRGWIAFIGLTPPHFGHRTFCPSTSLAVKNIVSIRWRFHRGFVRIIVFDLELKHRWTEAPYFSQTAIEM